MHPNIFQYYAGIFVFCSVMPYSGIFHQHRTLPEHVFCSRSKLCFFSIFFYCLAFLAWKQGTATISFPSTSVKVLEICCCWHYKDNYHTSYAVNSADWIIWYISCFQFHVAANNKQVFSLPITNSFIFTCFLITLNGELVQYSSFPCSKE